jgi:hypothetical protein
VAQKLLEHGARPDVRRRDQVRQGTNVVPCASSPWNLTEVEIVGDPVIRERHPPMLVDGIPQPEFCGDAAIKPI